MILDGLSAVHTLNKQNLYVTYFINKLPAAMTSWIQTDLTNTYIHGITHLAKKAQIFSWFGFYLSTFLSTYIHTS